MTMVELWTDGACSPNPGKGGWGWCTHDGQREGSGARPNTTNQRMELEAAGQGMLALYRDDLYAGVKDLLVMSDSKYLVDCMNQKWYRGWERRGWTTSKGDPVKNKQLWEIILRITRAWEARGVRVTFTWVKGHAGNALNERADALAVAARMKL